MSIKISKGFKIPHREFSSVLSWVQDVRKDLTTCATDWYHERIFETTIFNADMIYLKQQGYHNSEIDEKDMFDIHNELRREIKEGYRNSDDPTAEIVLTYSHLIDSVLGVIFCDCHPIVDRFFEFSGVQVYPYWDNTDKPEDVSQSEWDIRKKAWEETICAGTYKQMGMTFQLVDLPSPPHRLKWESLLPDIDKRVNFCYRRIDLDRRCDELDEKDKTWANFIKLSNAKNPQDEGLWNKYKELLSSYDWANYIHR